ncbi:hypothetical protein N9O57_01040 [bacterium]|nr:hypothetical protein [bacterium]
MIQINFKQILLVSFSVCLLISCQSNEDGELNTMELSESEVSTGSITENDQGAPVPIFTQDFESFELNRPWTLTDFGISTDRTKEDFVFENEILFGLSWTKRTRNHMADLLKIERSEMTTDKANSICMPTIEIGKENVYGGENSNNQIAELDSGLNLCDIKGANPASLSINSMIPTEVGYKYRVELDYKMRSYAAQTNKSYKDLVVRFGSVLEKFDPIFDGFKTVAIDIVAARNFSKLVLRDNGLPDSYGILIDNIKIFKTGPVDNYESCASLFNINTVGFRKCIQGEIQSLEECDFDDIENLKIVYKKGEGVSVNRMNTANALKLEDAIVGKINFLSLGLRGKVQLSCKVSGHKALFDIYNKTLKLREISWGNVSVDSYPELAKIRVKLENCEDESLNRVVTVGSASTKELFTYKFDQDEQGRTYYGCKMSKLIIKDITPKGPSADGFDLNSVQFLD